MKKLLVALSALVLLLVVLAAGGAWYLRSAEPDHDRDAAIPGLKAPVEVWRDSMAVPHIWASSEADLLRALGYVHAQDRLWQMELLRRVADGRMAEVLGESLVETDRFLRTLGMGRAAAASERTLDAEHQGLLQAYADGVNAWIEDHPGALPPEFLALRFRPEPWTVRNTLSIGKIMAWDLADWSTGLDLQRAVDRVGPELAREVFPRYPDWGVRILGSDARWVDQGSTTTRADAAAPPARTSGAELPRIPALAARLLESASIARASNSWVVHGSRTRSGSPILANDPHLGLRAPSLWYVAALHGGAIQAAGVTIPGIPGVVLGHTASVAWGFTNAMVDDVDFFEERLSEDGSQYLTPAGWRPLEVREDTILVRGADPVVHRVRGTRHGPLMSDVEERGGDRVLAMRWTALEPSGEHRALLAMNRARSADELQRALRDFDSPHQNVVFADAGGTIGYRLVGRVPVRRSGDGLLPAPGWTGEHDWQGYLEHGQHPHVLNPAEGFIVTANNLQIGPEYPHRIGSYYADPFRAMRIREMLEGERDLTADDVARQQTDVRDAFAVRYLPLAVRAAEAAGEAAAAELLRGWDARAETGSRAAALFYSWYERLRRAVGADEYRGEAMYFPRSALNQVLDEGGGAWVDDVRTAQQETLDGLAAAAMSEAVDAVAGRTWGELHTTRIEHALAAARPLERLLGLSMEPFPSDGSPFTVNVAGYGSRPPFVSTHGASMRHVVDLADPDGAGGFIVPAGQSGLPFSPHYGDQLPLWRQGRLWRVPLDRGRAAARAVERMTLTGQQ